MRVVFIFKKCSLNNNSKPSKSKNIAFVCSRYRYDDLQHSEISRQKHAKHLFSHQMVRTFSFHAKIILNWVVNAKSWLQGSQIHSDIHSFRPELRPPKSVNKCNNNYFVTTEQYYRFTAWQNRFK